MVEGQIQGSMAMGLGIAVLEEHVYDEQSPEDDSAGRGEEAIAEKASASGGKDEQGRDSCNEAWTGTE